MFALKSLIFLIVVLATFASAAPTHHNRVFHKRASGSGCSSSTKAKPTEDLADSGSSAGKKATSTGKSTATGKATATGAAPETSATPTGNTTATTGSALVKAVFPVAIKTGSAGWTTVAGAQGALPLSDATLKPSQDNAKLKHPVVSISGKKAIQATYTKGSFRMGTSTEAGFSFYTGGAPAVDLTTAKEATLGYSVMFEKGFSFNKGGKLPGFYGGDSDSVARGCSGGRRDVKCWSARFMWRTGGAGEMYTYLPPYTISKYAANKKQCSVKPMSDCNPTYGASVGRGSFTFKAGEWNQISERVLLNDVGKANGELEMYYNGKSVMKVTGLILSDSAQGRIRGIFMQTFFGGHTSDFASPKTQSAYFADLSVAILQKF